MGVFKPAEVLDVLQEEEQENWSAADLVKLQQKDFFMTKDNALLEKLPYRWLYHYRCSDANCTGHKQTIVDWETGAFYRSAILAKGITDPEEVRLKMREKFLGQLCGKDRDTYFFTGNMAAHQASFLVLGVFWPPVSRQGLLF